MNGVVIWYSKKDFRAVIWCEDSKELGIATGPTAWRNPMAPVEIGDFVSLDSAGISDVRVDEIFSSAQGAVLIVNGIATASAVNAPIVRLSSVVAEFSFPASDINAGELTFELDHTQTEALPVTDLNTRYIYDILLSSVSGSDRYQSGLFTLAPQVTLR
jgi:hypothetical protein